MFSGHSRKLPIWTLIGGNNHPQGLCRFKWDSTQWRMAVSRDHAFLECLHVCHKILCTTVTLGCEEETGWTICHCGVTWSEYETGPYTAELSSYIIIFRLLYWELLTHPESTQLSSCFVRVWTMCGGVLSCVCIRRSWRPSCHMFSHCSQLYSFFFFWIASFTNPEITLLARLSSLLGTRICKFLLPLALT